MLERAEIEFVLEALQGFRMARRRDAERDRGENLLLPDARKRYEKSESDVAECSRLRIILKKALDDATNLP